MAKLKLYDRGDLGRFNKYLSLYKEHVEFEKTLCLGHLNNLHFPKRIQQRNLKRYLKILRCINTLQEIENRRWV